MEELEEGKSRRSWDDRAEAKQYRTTNTVNYTRETSQRSLHHESTLALLPANGIDERDELLSVWR